MSRLAVTTIFLASLGVGLGIWLVFNRWFVQIQNPLLERLNPANRVEATVAAAQGSVVRRGASAIKNRLFGQGAKTKAQRQQLFELPDLIELLAVTLNAGEGLYAALVQVSQRSTGMVATDLKRVVMGVQLGSELSTELAAWSQRAKSRQVSDLCTKLQLALVRGTPLAEMLTDQAGALRAEVQQTIVKKAAQNETRMLVPLIFLILPITVLFAVFPSLQLLQLTQ